MLGTDIIEIERVRVAASKPSFFDGVFTLGEKLYYISKDSRAEVLAGMFCAKEAVAKALGCGFRGFRPNAIEIMHDELGAPYVQLLGKAAEQFPDAQFELSVSHCKEYATATALWRNKYAPKADDNKK